MIDKSSKYWQRRTLFERRHQWQRHIDDLILALMKRWEAAPPVKLPELKVENLDCTMRVVQWI